MAEKDDIFIVVLEEILCHMQNVDCFTDEEIECMHQAIAHFQSVVFERDDVWQMLDEMRKADIEHHQASLLTEIKKSIDERRKFTAPAEEA